MHMRVCVCVACSSLVLEEVERQSTCELEADAVAADILNRLEIEGKSVSSGATAKITETQRYRTADGKKPSARSPILIAVLGRWGWREGDLGQFAH